MPSVASRARMHQSIAQRSTPSRLPMATVFPALGAYRLVPAGMRRPMPASCSHPDSWRASACPHLELSTRAMVQLRKSLFTCLLMCWAALYAARMLGQDAAEAGSSANQSHQAPVYLWFEPEWFPGVEGSFSYWTGTAQPTGHWGVAGPGISPEWTQGGESEWNSLGAAAQETQAVCSRQLVVPRSGDYHIWVRYVDHRGLAEPFRVRVVQEGRSWDHEFGLQDVVPRGDEYALYWGFSFAWASARCQLLQGRATLELSIDRPGEAWRQVDAVLLTDDLSYVPYGREKPPFAWHQAVTLAPSHAWEWRGSARGIDPHFPQPKLAGRAFAMWTGVDADSSWWAAQDVARLDPYDVFFQLSPAADIRTSFHAQFAGRRDVEILRSPLLVPGFYLGATPDFSAGSPLNRWLQRTGIPFYVLTNYADPQYNDQTGPATYAALTGELASQFLGYIHGEAVGTPGLAMPDRALGHTRREHIDAWGRTLISQQQEAWSRIYHTTAGEEHFRKSISCLSVDSISLAHLFHELGAPVVGYEVDSTNVHVPMRIAFERGAARQYGGAWINYASGNFGDSCNYFTQEPAVPRGAPAWFHSKYAITDGVSTTWYRKLYYLNYLSGAAAIFWEQGLRNQWILPGPGKHPVQLSPFGRATADFLEFVERLPDRGEPLAPIAILLSYGHGYDRVNYHCKMLGVFHESAADLELRELFNVCWHPAGIVEGLPAAPDVQSMPGGIYGNIFDVLVDRPARAEAILHYPVVWAAGDVEFHAPWPDVLQAYLHRGGTLVLNVVQAAQLPEALTGLRIKSVVQPAEAWSPDGHVWHPTTPYDVQLVDLAGAVPLAWAADGVPLVTRHTVSEGAVLVILVPRCIGQDERAHPVLPWVLNGLTQKLLPIDVVLTDGRPLAGQVMYQVNRTHDGYLVLLINNLGVDKTPNGVARVDRRQAVDVELRTDLALTSCMEYTLPQELAADTLGSRRRVRLSIPAGDLRVIHLQVAHP